MVALVALLALAAGLRLYGIRWDAGFHLHPDERFLALSLHRVDWPEGIGQYLNES